MSAAGQQETYLDVLGEEAVIESVRRCWASLWTARAIAYRAALNVPNREVGMAVVVQEMVPADVSGVLFTADPITGRPDRVVLNAVRGLGESLVGGSATPDVFVIDKASGSLVKGTNGATPSGNLAPPEGFSRSKKPPGACLAPRDVARLARVGLRIEELFGRPMDVEWAIRGGRISILQARPDRGLPTARSGGPLAK